MQYELKENPNWAKAPMIPKVTVETAFDSETLQFIFDVEEPRDCFRQACFHDGDPCWQDSCVEVFLAKPASSEGTYNLEEGGYFNFECSSSGACLAEFGKSRSPRRAFTPEEYKQIKRTVLIVPNIESSMIHWSIKIEIPCKLIGIINNCRVYGNLYKCASGAKIPHYLSLFPIQSEGPDFHRPECFDQFVIRNA